MSLTSERDLNLSKIPALNSEIETEYQNLLQTALRGDHQSAEIGLNELLGWITGAELKAKINNDLGVLASVSGRISQAFEYFRKARKLAPFWSVPIENELKLREWNSQFNKHSQPDTSERATKIAIISLLFNWPSTGGGTIHTAETGKFLTEAGFDTRHFFAQYPEWGLGNLTDPPLSPSEALHFTQTQWTVENVQRRFKEALDAFAPDYVIVTDTWNSKPVLAKAAAKYRFFLRIAAQECLCPLNNVRLLFDEKFHSCPKHQLATPEKCCDCVKRNGKFSGSLHQAEREWSRYGSNEYDQLLRWSFAEAEAVLVVNPLIGAMLSPFAKKVCVIPSGFDPKRFDHLMPRKTHQNITRILFAGLVEEPMKGFQVVLKACETLWNQRQDFELVATADPIGQVNPFTRNTGWQTQSDLPKLMAESDIVVFPTVAEEALGRTAVEAMAAARAVVASRIGGLQFSVIDGATGLLFRPGAPEDLAIKLNKLLDNPELRMRMGQAGRERFEEHFTWKRIIDEHYLPLFGPAKRLASTSAN